MYATSDIIIHGHVLQRDFSTVKLSLTYFVLLGIAMAVLMFLHEYENA